MRIASLGQTPIPRKIYKLIKENTTMTYTLDLAKDEMAIGEREYGIGQEVKFTTFTSCIGILALTNESQIIAIHLALMDEDDWFSSTDIPTIQAVLNDHSNHGEYEIQLVGQISFWESPLNGPLSEAYTALVAALNPSKFVSHERDGTYGAKISGGEITVTFEPSA
jgi:hypothetical protein